MLWPSSSSSCAGQGMQVGGTQGQAVCEDDGKHTMWTPKRRHVGPSAGGQPWTRNTRHDPRVKRLEPLHPSRHAAKHAGISTADKSRHMTLPSPPGATPAHRVEVACDHRHHRVLAQRLLEHSEAVLHAVNGLPAGHRVRAGAAREHRRRLGTNLHGGRWGASTQLGGNAWPSCGWGWPRVRTGHAQSG